MGDDLISSKMNNSQSAYTASHFEDYADTAALTSTKERNIGHKRREKNLSPRRGVASRSFQKDRFADVPPNASRFATSDIVVDPLGADLAKGTICVKKKKITGVTSCTAVSNQVWVTCDDGKLKVMSHNARDLIQFDDSKYTFVTASHGKVYATTEDGSVCIYDKNFTLLGRLTRNPAEFPAARAVTLTYDDGYVWVAYSDSTIGQWALESGAHVNTIECPAMGEVQALLIVKNRGGGSALWTATNQNIFLFDPSPATKNPHEDEDENGEDSEHDPLLEVLKSPTGAEASSVTCLVQTNGSVWAGYVDGSIVVWNTETLQPVKRLLKHNGPITTLEVVGTRIWSGSSDCKVAVWTPATNELIGVIPGVYKQIVNISVVGMYVWVATIDEMLRVFIAQGLIEDAHDYLKKYSLNSIRELEQMFTSAVADNEVLSNLLRQLKAVLLLGHSWYPRNSVPHFIDKRYEHESYDLAALTEQLRNFERHWDEQKNKILDTWDLPTLVKGLQTELACNDQVKTELHALKLLFAEVERNLKAECDRLMAECDKRQRECKIAEEELQEAERQAHADAVMWANKNREQEEKTSKADKKLAEALEIKKPLQDRADELKRTIAGLEDKIKELDEAHAACESARAKVQKEINQYNQLKATYESDIKQLQEEEKSLRTGETELSRQLEDLAKRNKDMEAQVAKKDAQFQSANAGLATQKNLESENKKKLEEKQKIHDHLAKTKPFCCKGCSIL